MTIPQTLAPRHFDNKKSEFSSQRIRYFLIACSIGASLSTTACQSTNSATSKKDTGAVMGMLIGGIIGAAIGGKDSGAMLGAVLGATVGGLAGATIGAELDEADKIRAAAAAQAAVAVPTGDRVEWKSEKTEPIGGYATPINDITFENPNECRKVRQVSIINGKEIEEVTKFCRKPNSGTWVAS